jgi:hypothetical protein
MISLRHTNRKRRIRRLTAAAAAAAVGIIAAAAAPADAVDKADDAARRLPAWPLDAEKAISSNFCEYREGHFHAGLDLRTFGEEGVPCLASGGGYVSRLRASPEGYGKVVYVQLDSGETLVYAHLAEFKPELEEVLYEAQLRAGQYTVDLRFPRGRFPVERGEVIAYSGRTGGTAPHLHFEIRDAGENPLNPFSNGFAMDDRLSPEVERVEFAPLSTDARVNGHCWPVELNAVRTGAGSYEVRDTMYVVGDVGLSVELFDRLNGKSGRLAPYRVTLAVDDSVVADIRLERFSFSHTGQVDFLYDIARVRREKAYFVQLFENGGESLWNHTYRLGGSLGGAPGDGLHTGVVTAADVTGNTARLTFRFFTGTSRPLPARAWKNARLRSGTDPPGFYIRGGFLSARRPVSDPRLTAPPKTADDPDMVRRVEGYHPPHVYSVGDLLDGPFAVPARESDDGNNVYLMGVEEGIPTTVGFPELKLQLVTGERTLYADQVLYAAPWRRVAGLDEQKDLVPAAGPVRIGPYSATLRADMEIRFLSSRLDSTTAIYRLNERKQKWVFYESEAAEGVLSTTAKRPGVYAVFSDETGPRIGKPFTRWRTSYATGKKRPEIVAPVEDAGAGLDYRKTAVFLAGAEQIAYWDSQAKKLFVVVGDPNIMGRQAISVVAYDQAGNRSQLDATIEIPRTTQPNGNE